MTEICSENHPGGVEHVELGALDVELQKINGSRRGVTASSVVDGIETVRPVAPRIDPFLSSILRNEFCCSLYVPQRGVTKLMTFVVWLRLMLC